MKSNQASRRLSESVASIMLVAGTSVVFATPPVKESFGPFEATGFPIGDCGTFQILNDFVLNGFFIEHFDKDGKIPPDEALLV